MKESGRFIFVIDTKEYSGDFERELCATVTGIVGDCGVGGNLVKPLDVLMEEHPEIVGIPEIMYWIEQNVLQQADEETGCYRPCDVWPTPGRSNDGGGVHYDITEAEPARYHAYESVAIFFKEQPPQSVVNFMKARAKTFGRGVHITNFRLLEEKTMVVTTTISEGE